MTYTIGYFDFTFIHDSMFSLSLSVLLLYPSFSLHLSPSTPPVIFCFPLLLLSLCSLPETFTVSTTLEISTERDHEGKPEKERGSDTRNNFPSPVRDAAEKGRSKVTAPIFAVTAEFSTYMPRRLFFLYFYAHFSGCFNLTE